MNLPDPPAPSLRERKKAAAMRHIQSKALELFLARGFDHVTVEEVAAASEASASTVYRYFGTKEGLVLHDEFDDRLLVAIGHFLTEGLTPWEAAMAAFGTIEEEHFVAQEESARERLRLFFEVPSIRSAAYLVIDGLVDQLAHLMAETGRWSLSQGRVITSAMVWPFVATLKNWHESEDVSWHEHLDEAITTLTQIAPR